MKYFIGIDDTDNLYSIGTGELAENLGSHLKENDCGTPSRVTRHQLFFNDAIAYTSHNSAMCFELNDCDKDMEFVAELCGSYIECNCAEGSDPGLCILNPELLKNCEELVSFGKQAKSKVLLKRNAYDLAHKYDIHLSEHGGSGIGVIGALAGVALRMDGSDGRYKGQYRLGINSDNMLVKDILMHPDIDSIQDKTGYILKDNEEVFITEKVKTVRLNGQSVLIVEEVQVNEEIAWKNVEKKQLKEY